MISAEHTFFNVTDSQKSKRVYSALSGLLKKLDEIKNTDSEN